MKTVFIITDLKHGGIETYLLRFISLYKEKIKPIILCCSYPNKKESLYEKLMVV